jgi:hypothetical protein
MNLACSAMLAVIGAAVVLAGCDRDCEFPSGRTCNSGEKCQSDDLCNTCQCSHGELSITDPKTWPA